MPQSTVCALLPTHNRANYIGECINSLLNQTRPLDQIIIIDDGSTDATENVVRSYTDPRIQLISQSNAGKAAALNAALAQCTADYVWVCDDDDIALSHGLEKLASLLDADATIDMACGRLLSFHDNDPKRQLYDNTYLPRIHEPKVKLNFLENMFTNQFAMLVRRDLYQKVGPFNVEMIRAQDIEMVLRLTRHAKVAFTPDIIFHYRQHGGLRGSTIDRFKAADNAKKWQIYCSIIYNKINASYELGEFRPTFALDWEPSLAHRAELLEHALIFANQSLWAIAISDLKAAAVVASNPIHSEEIDLARSIIVHDMPWELLSQNTDWVNELHYLYKSTEYGKAIIPALCLRLYRYAARQGLKKFEVMQSLKMLGLLVKILGITGAMRLLAASPLG